jgi:hypothetical protein
VSLRLASVILARTLAYVESFDLNPRGKTFYPDIVHGLVERYKFQKFPKQPEEFDEAKGVVFEYGKFGPKVIYKFTIFNTLLALETRSSTADSQQLIEEMLEWGAQKFGLTYAPGMIKHFGYISDLTFYSDVPILDAACQPLVDLATKTGAALSEIHKEPFQYYPANLAVGHDPLAKKNGIAPFTITRRAESRFSENKYFSEAPLPTDMHIAFLEEFEAGIKRLHEAQRGNR